MYAHGAAIGLPIHTHTHTYTYTHTHTHMYTQAQQWWGSNPNPPPLERGATARVWLRVACVRWCLLENVFSSHRMCSLTSSLERGATARVPNP